MLHIGYLPYRLFFLIFLSFILVVPVKTRTVSPYRLDMPVDSLNQKVKLTDFSIKEIVGERNFIEDELGLKTKLPRYDLPIKIVFRSVEAKLYSKERLRFRVIIYNQMLDRSFRFYSFKNFFNQIYLTIRNDQGEILARTIDFNRFLIEKHWQDHDDEIESTWLDQQLVDRRLIEVLPEESFSFVVSIDRFYEIFLPGRYFAEGFFYPLGVLPLKKNQDSRSLSSDNEGDLEGYRLKIEKFAFEVLPDFFDQNHFLEEGVTENGNIGFGDRNKRPLSDSIGSTFRADYPDEVVKQHIEAIRNKHWEEYFSTIYLEKFLVYTYPMTDYYEQFQSAYPHEKKIIIDRFKNFLIRSIDYDVEEYKVIKTVTVEDKSEVRVMVALAESFQDLVERRSPESGLSEKQWVKGKDHNLKQKWMMTFKLEQIDRLNFDPIGQDSLDPLSQRVDRVWKIVDYGVKILDQVGDDQGLPVEESKSDFFKEIILFSLNNDEINPKYFPFLDHLASFLIDHPDLKIDLEGHTDDLGGTDYNNQLSLARARSVLKYLTGKGIEVGRIRVIPKGESEPFQLGTSEASRSLNRRVKMVVREER